MATRMERNEARVSEYLRARLEHLDPLDLSDARIEQMQRVVRRIGRRAYGDLAAVVAQMRYLLDHPDGMCSGGSNEWYARTYLRDAKQRRHWVILMMTATRVG